MSFALSIRPSRSWVILAAISLFVTITFPLTAQQTGRVEGTVVRALDGAPVGGVTVEIVGTGVKTVTDPDGHYLLSRVPTGTRQILYRWLGYQPQQATVTVLPGATQNADVRLEAQVISLGEITVTGASRAPERIVEAPAAISIISPVTLRNQSATGQAPRALAQVPGVDIVQSGVNDFNVNARGFNSSLNRRVLVLQDGRDLAIAFLGSQEWNSMSIPLDDIGVMEMVRGPGSALYGANAFSGVINITTPLARDVVGTKASISGGELTTLRADIRHAGASQDGRFGYKFNFGYNRGNTWSRSRTRVDGSDVIAEYNDAADVKLVAGATAGIPTCQTVGPDCLGPELLPLSGQTIIDSTGALSGDADNIQNILGSGRFDYYADNGSIFTVEGGATQVENELFVTGIGRVQVEKALRPWARVAWGSDNYNVMAWYSGRNSIQPQVSLSSGLDLEESSAIFHFEGQYNRSFADDKARIVLGASFRNYNVNTEGTLMALANDDRSDNYSSAYGQLELRPFPQVRLVGAARVDKGTLFNTQFSPKGAVVYSPHEDHSFRFSVNRAFQTPNYSEFFLNVQASATPNPGALEQGVEGYYAALQNPAVVGPALAGLMGTLGLPAGIDWDFAALTPVMALGNEALDVEKVTGYELGYKGNLGDRAYVSVDVYLNQLSNFVTDLLFGANQAQYPAYDIATGAGSDVLADLAAIDAILAALGPSTAALRAINAQLVAGYNSLAGTPGLTDFNGVRSIALSYAQAGEVDEAGVEFGLGYGFTPEFRVDASYTYFDFEIQNPGAVALGQTIEPNTPQHKVNLSFTYTGLQGFDASLNTRFVDGYKWNAGVFAGTIPSNQMIDLSVGYRVDNNWRLYAIGTNLLDQQRFQLYGGSVIGRRILGGLTATF